MQYSKLIERLKEDSEDQYWKITYINTDNFLKLFVGGASIHIHSFNAHLFSLVNNPDRYVVNIYKNKYVNREYLYVRDTKSCFVGRCLISEDKSKFFMPIWVPESAQKKVFKETKEIMIAEDTKGIARHIALEAMYEGLQEKHRRTCDDLQRVTKEYDLLADQHDSLNHKIKSSIPTVIHKDISDFSEEELLSHLAQRVRNKPKKAIKKPKLDKVKIIQFEEVLRNAANG